MTAAQLVFQPEEPGDDPLSDKVFAILDRVLQPSSTVSLDAAVTQITALLPEGRPYSTEVRSFVETCYEIAEQIPYHHDSMVKLVTIIDLCLSSSRFPKIDDSGDIQTDPKYRYQKLGETQRDWWNTNSPGNDVAKYINFQTFVARIYQRGLIEGYFLSICVLRSAFEDQEGSSQAEHEAYVTAALQHLLLGGSGIYQEVEQHRWRLWHERIGAVAAGKVDNGAGTYSQDVIQLAGQATVAMEAIERLKVG